MFLEWRWWPFALNRTQLAEAGARHLLGTKDPPAPALPPVPAVGKTLFALGGNPHSLHGYWPMDEGLAVRFDWSGNGRHMYQTPATQAAPAPTYLPQVHPLLLGREARPGPCSIFWGQGWSLPPPSPK